MSKHPNVEPQLRLEFFHQWRLESLQVVFFQPGGKLSFKSTGNLIQKTAVGLNLTRRLKSGLVPLHEYPSLQRCHDADCSEPSLFADITPVAPCLKVISAYVEALLHVVL